ncbi:MAG: endonuclease MutS2 [Anaerolineae bacterium]
MNDDRHLKTLEFPKILERLARHAMFSAGKDLARNLTPTPYLSEARTRQAETREARYLLDLKPDAGLGGARDVRPLVEQARRGFALPPQDLLNIRQTLVAARSLRRTVARLADQLPHLAETAQRLADIPGLVNEIGRCIDDYGEVQDGASPDLARIRREIRVTHDRLLDKLNRLVNSPQTAQYLQESLVTQRDGRYVVPLKAEFKGRVRGIIHHQSASGATLFIEPLATVEMNNRLRQLELDEEQEVRRILLALSALVADEGKPLAATVEALAGLDLAFAKARYAAELEAVEPELVGFRARDRGRRADDQEGEPGPLHPGTSLRLLSARHPLLDPQTVVPIDVVLDEETYILVITGPNTGGKTVSLKTVGLLALMAQAGLHLPAAEGSSLSVFDRVLADIGDEQSIEQSLSTFSAHMTNIVGVLEACSSKSLVIFDELGAGTDPLEGAALARAILGHLLERGVTTLVATHYSELKAFAHTTPGLRNASMEFDLETLSPTFRLSIGLPGRSNAFAIAQRLGLETGIIDGARALVSEDARRTDALLAEIETEVEAAKRERARAAAERQRAEAQHREIAARLEAIDEERRAILNQARAEARRELDAAQTEIRRLKEEARSQLAASRSGKQLRQAEASLNALEGELAPLPSKPAAPEQPKALPGRARPGDKVWVAGLDRVGEVIGVQGDQLEVQIGRFRTTVRREDTELRQRQATRAEPPARSASLPPAESPGLELNLRGQTTDEALLHLEQYLDRAYLAGLPWVRIIHGKGTGTLRRMVRRELGRHPLVASHEPGKEGEGGDGVTVARLAVG